MRRYENEEIDDSEYGRLKNELTYGIARSVRGEHEYILLGKFRRIALSESRPVYYRLLVKKYGEEKAKQTLKEEDELAEEAAKLLKMSRIKRWWD